MKRNNRSEPGAPVQISDHNMANAAKPQRSLKFLTVAKTNEHSRALDALEYALRALARSKPRIRVRTRAQELIVRLREVLR